MTTAVVIFWDDPFSIVSSAARGIGDGLLSIGFDVKYLNVMDSALSVKEPELGRYLTDPEMYDCDIAISVGAPPLSIRIGDQWLFEVMGKSFFLYSVDSLIYDHSRVNGVSAFLDAATTSRRLAILSPDRDATEVINQLAPHRIAYYVPWAGFFHPLVSVERINRIAVIGTMGLELGQILEGDFTHQVHATVPPSIEGNPQLTDFAAEIEKPGQYVSIVNLARDVLGLPAATIFSRELTSYLSGLDAYQKRRRRMLAISALSAFPVDFFGTGWEPFGAHFVDARFMGAIAHHQIADVCERYSALMNFDPNWGHGLHDRVYTAIGTGCRVLTNESRALGDLTTPGLDAAMTYDANLPDLTDVAERALSLPEVDPTSLGSFRLENSWLARMDRFTSQRNNVAN